MISLSTSCLDAVQPLTVRLERLFSCPVHGYELYPGPDSAETRETLRAIRRSGRSVTNLFHHSASGVEGTATRLADPSIHISSLDRAKRNEAVRQAEQTMEWAARAETGIVVIPCGETSASFPYDLFDAGRRKGRASPEECAHLRRQFANERRKSAAQHIDALFCALDELLQVAERLEISIALPLPLSPSGIPAATELEFILREFQGARLGSWYRSAHANYQERLGFGDLRELRHRVRHAMLGCGIQDLTAEDEIVLPGEGVLDLRSDLDFLPPAQPLVIEATPKHDIERIASAVTLLRSLGFEGPPAEPCEPFPIFGGP